MLKRHNRYILVLTLEIIFTAIAGAQNLRGDPRFPVLNELDWKMNIQEVQTLCQKHNLSMSSSDSSIVVNVSFFDAPTRTEFRFDRDQGRLKLVQAKFKEPSALLLDTLLRHLTKIYGADPYRTSKEKSLLIVTIRMQMAIWKSPTEVVNLITGMRGDSIFDVSLVLFPPSKQQNPDTKK